MNSLPESEKQKKKKYEKRNRLTNVYDDGMFFFSPPLFADSNMHTIAAISIGIVKDYMSCVLFIYLLLFRL